MKLWPFRRKPLITEDVYGRLMTSFGRIIDREPLLKGPAAALAERIVRERPDLVERVDARLYRGAALYHLRLLAGSWIMAREGSVPAATAEVFEEAVVWKFAPAGKECAWLPRRVSQLARGEVERQLLGGE
jgi:hypothetical protein